MRHDLKQFTIFFAVLVLALTTGIFSQQKQLSPFNVFYAGSNDINNPMPSATELPAVEKSSRQKELELQLESARLSNNTISAKHIQSQLNNLLGHVSVTQQNSPFTASIPGGDQEHDYSQVSIHNLSIYSHSFGIAPANSPMAGKLFYLMSQDAFVLADSLKLMTSTDNGTSWSTAFLLGVNGYDFNNDEMDIEIVYDGTNTWVFGVVGLTDRIDSRKKSYFFRWNATLNQYYGTMLNFPGIGTNMHYYNPRLTSDNSTYAATAYVMILCSMDSVTVNNRYIKQKYALSTNPFNAVPNLDYAQPGGEGGFAWWGTTGLNIGYVYGDIAYYKDDGGTGHNRVASVMGMYGAASNYNIYIAYLNSYSTYGAALFIPETNVHKHVKIAYNGGSNNRNGMITYVKRYNATDWDVFALKTSNGGSSPAGWTRDTVDFTGEFARNCDLIALRNATNQFRVAYTQDNSGTPKAFYRSFNGSSWSARYQFSNNSVDTLFARTRIGYLHGGGDDGTGIWSNIGGFNGYFTKQMMTTTGITGNNEIPSGFSLSQNYPNPFNPVTSIKFSIPSAGIVTLKIFDITGKEVAAVVNQNMNAGNYTVNFDASNLSSGAYFYKLTSGGFTAVKKMILVK